MIEYRVRNSLSDEALKPMWGKIVTEAERSLTVSGPIRVLKPNGDVLLVYVPGALLHRGSLLEDSYAVLHELRKYETTNRGLASGTQRYERYAGSPRTESKAVASAIVGAFDPLAPYYYCRLTAWTGNEWDKFAALFPLFGAIAETFQTHVPDRFGVQAAIAANTDETWRIRGTPFTTITVNNTYPTGVHVDKGDLQEGFSCLAVLRRGHYTGGVLTFPKYRIGVDMMHGDVLLMDAHEAHGNTMLRCVGIHHDGSEGSHSMGSLCEDADTERISIVAYYRTRMKDCGTREQEWAKRTAWVENNNTEASDEELLKETVSRGAYEG